MNVPDHNLFKQPQMKVTKAFVDEEAASDDEIEDDVSSLESGNISISPIKISTFDKANLKAVDTWLGKF